MNHASWIIVSAWGLLHDYLDGAVGEAHDVDAGSKVGEACLDAGGVEYSCSLRSLDVSAAALHGAVAAESGFSHAARREVDNVVYSINDIKY